MSTARPSEIVRAFSARDRWRLAAILAVAAALRFVGLDWDQGHGFHPDERRIAFALGDLSFHPLQLNPHFFAYGSFPLYVQKLWVSIAGWLHPAWKGFHGEILTGRALSAVLGVAMVAGVAALGRRLYGPRSALLAALFLALSVLPIQHAHFITVDLYQSALVLFALERLVAFLDDGRRSRFVTAAAITGFALATKVSSVPLLLPLLLAPLAAPASRESRLTITARLGLLAGGLIVVAAAFLAGEPYAVLDRAAFLHDVREQAEMVRNPGSVPYTIQYLGTTPYLDDLRQAFTWGMGPFLGFAALLGTVTALARAARRRAEVLVLSFFLPYFLVTGAFPVKFMRYLLPLYPIWCLYAAALLAAGEGRLWRAAAWIVVAATAAYALAFASIYSRPHVWVTASRWFHREIPEGSMVLTPHWEEGFPVDVEGHGGGRFRHAELPLYEPDNEKKIELLADRLAEGDALVFPSKRLYGSISNAPVRYPRTSRLLELLFAGELGYRLDRVFASRPALLGFELDDDFADESFSVYDHPKTLIFRKAEALGAAEIAARVRSRIPSGPIHRADLLGADTGKQPAPEESAPTRIESSVPALLVWLIALAALSFAGRRILGSVLPGAPELAVAGLGPPLGVLLFEYLSWILAALGWVPFAAAETLVVAAALVLVARRLPAARAGVAGAVFYGAFLFFLAVRAWNPEIYWGEKPMDFSFLNALYRTAAIPPPEPWMAGKIINYSYFGHFGVAAIGKLTAVSPALAFNLGISTIAGLTASAAFGVGALLTGGSSGAVAAALLVAFAGNLSGPFTLSAHGLTVGFDYFWATSRVIRDTINEFPLWSFLFADLHAHVMALPLALLLLGLVYTWFAQMRSRPTSLALLASLTLGAIATTNTWGLPIYTGAIAGTSVLAAISERRPRRLLFAPLVLALSYVWFLPYWRRFVAPPRNWGFEHASAPLLGVLAIFGLFLFAALRALSAFGRRRPRRLWLRASWLAALVLVAWISTRGGFFFLGATCLIAALAESAPAPRLAFALAGAAAVLGGLTDTFYLWDRMNTIFKAYLEMWLFFAVASACLLRSPAAAPNGLWRWLDRSALTVLVLLSAFTATTDVVGTLRTVRVPGPRPTLDGTAYLDSFRPFDAMAIRWLNRNTIGSPVLLEAHGPSYQEFSRISMNTGLPTVLGWDYHLSQRAHPWAEIDRRKADVQALYSSEDRAEVERLSAAYDVAMIYVGDLERRTYPLGLDKFDKWTDLFQPIYRNPGVSIYGVPANFRWSETAPVVEEARGEPTRGEQAAAPETAPAQLPPGRLRQPRGLAVDSQGNVWVADFGNNRIQGFDASLQPLRAFGSRGEGAGEFRDPCGIAIGPDGLLYVADTWNHRVQVFDPNGHLVRQWSGEFFGPRGISVARDGTVYVADSGNGRIAKFTADGRLLARFGKKGSGHGELNEPMGVVATDDGKVYVADAGNRRIVVLSPDGAELATWPVAGWKTEVFREPYLAALADGRVVATDPTGDRLLVFDPSGRLVREQPLAAGSNPSGIAVLSKDRLVVSALKQDKIFVAGIP